MTATNTHTADAIRRAPGAARGAIRAVTIAQHRARGTVTLGHTSADSAVTYATQLLLTRAGSRGAFTWRAVTVQAGPRTVGTALTVYRGTPARLAALERAAVLWRPTTRGVRVASPELECERKRRASAARAAYLRALKRQVAASERVSTAMRRRAVEHAAVLEYAALDRAREAARAAVPHVQADLPSPAAPSAGQCRVALPIRPLPLTAPVVADWLRSLTPAQHQALLQLNRTQLAAVVALIARRGA